MRRKVILVVVATGKREVGQGGGSSPIGWASPVESFDPNFLPRDLRQIDTYNLWGQLNQPVRDTRLQLDLTFNFTTSLQPPHFTVSSTMAGGGGKYRHLGRKSSHRQALLRNLVTSLFENESITTTWAKAKEAQRLADKLITLGKKNSEASRRRALEIFYVRNGSPIFSAIQAIIRL